MDGRQTIKVIKKTEKGETNKKCVTAVFSCVNSRPSGHPLIRTAAYPNNHLFAQHPHVRKAFYPHSRMFEKPFIRPAACSKSRLSAQPGGIHARPARELQMHERTRIQPRQRQEVLLSPPLIRSLTTEAIK